MLPRGLRPLATKNLPHLARSYFLVAYLPSVQFLSADDTYPAPFLSCAPPEVKRLESEVRIVCSGNWTLGRKVSCLVTTRWARQGYSVASGRSPRGS